MEDLEPFDPFRPPRRELARSPCKQDILDISLVLASQSVKHWMEFHGDEWSLSVDERDAEPAAALIETWRQENEGFTEAPPEDFDLDLLVAPLLFLAIPVAAYFLVGFSPWAEWLKTRGEADAARILAGEWWRCLTAATLHADDAHLLSNLVSGYFILNLLNHRLGIGTLMLLSTLAAGVDNFLVALATGPGHVSLGYSSVVFCALGLLAGVETWNLWRRRRDHAVRQGKRPGDGAIRFAQLRRLSPLISALFVAVLVGIGEGVDVKAHFYGFGLGAALGLVTPLLPRRLARPGAQAGLAIATFALYACGWILAIRE
ncbi:MAG: rhomboid family intramembrane serine protease [Fibrobacteres bacterium]|nr:rhomboid family intramembrane serine protease [Fibrobacterota bacterium]